MALTTVNELNIYLGETSTSTLKTQAVDSASAMIEGYCGRGLEPKRLTGWHKASGGMIILPEAPAELGVISVWRALQCLRVTCDATGVVSNSVVVGNDQLKCTSGNNVLILTPSAYSTMALLAAAVTADSRWTGAALYEAVPLSLRQIQARLTTDCFVDIDAAYDIAEGYQIDAGAGIVSGLASGFYWIDYIGGMAAIPDEIGVVAVQLAAAWLQQPKDPTMQSEKIGDYSYTRASGVAGILEPFTGILDGYRRRSL